MVSDPLALKNELKKKHRQRLLSVNALADPMAEAWALLGGERRNAYDAFRLIVGD